MAVAVATDMVEAAIAGEEKHLTLRIGRKRI
jgi:hypothetical protein